MLRFLGIALVLWCHHVWAKFEHDGATAAKSEKAALSFQIPSHLRIFTVSRYFGEFQHLFAFPCTIQYSTERTHFVLYTRMGVYPWRFVTLGTSTNVTTPTMICLRILLSLLIRPLLTGLSIAPSVYVTLFGSKAKCLILQFAAPPLSISCSPPPSAPWCCKSFEIINGVGHADVCLLLDDLQWVA